jgi:hypothetical protein
MNSLSRLFADPPELSDEAAAQMLDLLYELMSAFENQYTYQIRQYYKPESSPQYNLIPDFDDDLPDF